MAYVLSFLSKLVVHTPLLELQSSGVQFGHIQESYEYEDIQAIDRDAEYCKDSREHIDHASAQMSRGNVHRRSLSERCTDDNDISHPSEGPHQQYGNQYLASPQSASASRPAAERADISTCPTDMSRRAYTSSLPPTSSFLLPASPSPAGPASPTAHPRLTRSIPASPTLACGAARGSPPGTQFTCFTSTKVQILTQQEEERSPVSACSSSRFSAITTLRCRIFWCLAQGQQGQLGTLLSG
jgi:hypothetical protein